MFNNDFVLGGWKEKVSHETSVNLGEKTYQVVS